MIFRIVNLLIGLVNLLIGLVSLMICTHDLTILTKIKKRPAIVNHSDYGGKGSR
jgi:hypothetical protein